MVTSYLQTENDKLKQLLQLAKIGWWEADLEEKRYTCSDYLTELLGLTTNSLGFEEYRSLVREEFHSQVLFDFTTTSLPVCGKSYPVRTRNGEVWVNVWHGQPKLSAAGRQVVTGIMQFGKDPAEDSPDNSPPAPAPHQQDVIFDTVYNNLPVGVELYDNEGVLVDINQTDIEIFGLRSEEEILGSLLFEHPLIPQPIKDKFRNGENIDHSWVFDASVHTEAVKSHLEDQVHLITKGVVLKDEQGEASHYLLIHMDNTETTSAYSRVKEFEQYFSVMADFSRIGYCKWNPVKGKGYALHQWLKNLEKPAGVQFTSLSEVYQHVYPDDFLLIRDFYKQVLQFREDARFQGEIRVIRSDGTLKWLRTNIMAHCLEPQERGVELTEVSIDISAQKQVEVELIQARMKAENLDRLKSAFLANMSHEIRTPLNAIVGFSSLMMESASPEEQQQYHTIVRENNELLLQLISDILDLSKIESGTLEVVQEVIHLKELCQQIQQSYRERVNTQIPVLFDTRLPDYRIYSDRNRLAQVITQFINNSLKFTEQGSISISYRVLNEKELEISVTDTGIGIVGEEVASVFDRFVKLNTFAQGTGLGLSICKSIVEQMNGRIGVSSIPGEGSRFWFTHPYLKDIDKIETDSVAPEILAGPMTFRPPSDQPMEEKPLLLVAEDTDSNYMLIKAMLKNDYTLIRALNGREAVEIFDRVHPRLILMDVRMPEMDGLEATRLIRAKNAVVPIIVVTAFALDSDRQKAIDSGCNDYLSKPVNARLLKEKIEAWLRPDYGF